MSIPKVRFKASNNSSNSVNDFLPKFLNFNKNKYKKFCAKKEIIYWKTEF